MQSIVRGLAVCAGVLAAVVALQLALAGSARAEGEPIIVDEPLSFAVDETLMPSAEELAAVVDSRGNRAEFVADELVVVTDDDAILDRFRARWGGELVSTLDPAEHGLDGLERQHLVRIDTSLTDPRRLEEDLELVGVEAGGRHRVTSEAGLGLIAAAARSAADGLTVGINWVVEGATIRTRSTREAPQPTRQQADPNACTWPAFIDGSGQDIGVCEAWSLLARAGRLPTASDGSDRIPIAILDGGFAPFDADTPPGSVQLASGRNPVECAAGPCPWHGTHVTSAAMAVEDNGFGGAGPAGPVARAIQAGLTTGSNAFRTIRDTTDAIVSAGSSARIINMSFQVEIPASLAWAAGGFDLLASVLRNRFGKVLFAAAGNAGTDVDEVHCFVKCWEAVHHWPCETPAVVCVGGLGNNSTGEHSKSNFAGGGNFAGSGTVDLWAPWFARVGPDPDNPANQVQEVGGTSMASPFAAGVAALVWTANPGLSPAGVEATLTRTARTGTGRVTSYVDAQAAVEDALGPDLPPDIRILEPLSGASVPRGMVRFRAAAVDREDGVPRVTWLADGVVLGEGTDVTLPTYHLPFGTRTITAVADDSRGWRVGDADGGVQLTLRNDPPTVSIVRPSNGQTVEPPCWKLSPSVRLEGTSHDPNDLPSELADSQVKWYVDGSYVGSGHEAWVTLQNGWHTARFEGTDGQHTVSNSTSFYVEWEQCEGGPTL